MQLKIKKTFDWAHGGIAVKTYTAGDEIETDDTEMVEVAVREGWASTDKPEKKTKKAEA